MYYYENINKNTISSVKTLFPLNKGILLVKHSPTCPGLRLFGLGPKLKPTNGLSKLQNFFDKNAFWARGRNKKQISQMLYHSTVVSSLWKNNELIGFGRATSDYVFRAVLWDVVIASNHQGQGLGKIIINSILTDKKIESAKRIYLMTTNCVDFYKQLGFKKCQNQSLLIFRNNI